MVELDKLPKDPSLLIQIISDLQSNFHKVKKDSLSLKKENQHLENEKVDLENEKAGLEAENQLLREALRLARMVRFAASSDQVPQTQGNLFDEVELEAQSLDLDESETQTISYQRKRPKRKVVPDELPREDVIIDLAEEDKVCSTHQCALKAMGEDITEKVGIVPAQVKVKRMIRKKYYCPSCDESPVKTAPLPPAMIPKSYAGSSLLSYIAINKYLDALPLYRIEQKLKRYEVSIPRNTMAKWMIQVGDRLKPLYHLMLEDLSSSAAISMDETPVQVLKEEGKPAQSKSYMWVLSRHGPGIRPIVIYQYSPTRASLVPLELLSDYSGYLQVDGYAGYDRLCRSEKIIRVSCLAHIRRKFVDTSKASQKKVMLVGQVLKLIGKLYKIEEKIKGLSAEERYQTRQSESATLMKKLGDLIQSEQTRHPPQGLLGKALNYASGQWPFMKNYLLSGEVDIDNNFIENRIRPFAIGRKNWLFSASAEGAESSGILYSIIQTARGSGLEPYAYLNYLFTHFPESQTLEELEQLLPHKINPELLNPEN